MQRDETRWHVMKQDENGRNIIKIDGTRRTWMQQKQQGWHKMNNDETA